MRLWSGILLVVGLFSASPVFAQASPSAYTTGYRYDAGRRLVGTISPDPDGSGSLHYAAVRNTYDPTTGQLVTVEKGELLSWKSESIAPVSWGSAFTVQSTLTTTYDAMGRKTKEALSGTGVTTTVTEYNYDSLGRLLCTAVRTAGAQSDACVPQTTSTNGPDQITHNVYDAAGRASVVQKGYGTSSVANYASYTYTPNGKQQDVTDANGNKAEFAYDGFDRLATWTFPSKTTAGQLNAADYEQYGYDNNGNRTSLRKRDGSTLTYAYDALDRVTTKTVPSRADLTTAQTRSVYYGYDSDGHQLYARFDGSAATNDGVTSVYTNFGELSASTLKMGTFSKALTASYDADGNRVSLVHPESTAAYTFTYAYDGLDRLQSISQGTTSPVLLDTFTYNTAQLVSARSEGTTGTSSVAYTWDKLGRLTNQNDAFSNATGNVGWTLGYSPASQMLSETRDNNTYAFDTTQIGGVNRNYAINGLNQYTTTSTSGTTTATFGYDNNANLTSTTGSTGSSAYTYDIENRLVKAVTGSITVNLTYDALGRLFEVVKTTSGTTNSDTRFLYDGDALALEYNGAATPVVINRYIHGSNAAADDPLLWYSGSGLSAKSWLHADHLGSIVAITDGTTALPTINSYDEYGINGTGNSVSERFGYTGQAFIPELGLYYYKARIYSPTLGRFLQTDPIGYDGGANLYGYVSDDPTDKTDPSGSQERLEMQTRQDDEALLKGKMSTQEYRDRQIARGEGGLAAVAIIGAAASVIAGPTAAAATAAGSGAAGAAANGGLAAVTGQPIGPAAIKGGATSAFVSLAPGGAEGRLANAGAIANASYVASRAAGDSKRVAASAAAVAGVVEFVTGNRAAASATGTGVASIARTVVTSTVKEGLSTVIANKLQSIGSWLGW